MSRASVLAGLLVLVPGVLLGILRSPFVVPSWDDPPASLQVKCVSSVSHGYNRGNVTEFPGECFFTDTYEDARLQFRDLANRCGAELLSLPVNKSDDLTTDVAIIRRSKEKMVVHISGTHGVEGFAGSAIQAAALHQLSLQPVADRNDESQPTLVFVHVQNPYGMKYNRRVNEHNVDLNRNFLSLSKWEFVLNRDANFNSYVDVKDIVSPSYEPYVWTIVNDAYYALLMVKVVVTGMMGHLKSALLSGNYHFPRGLGYGGQEGSQSYLNLKSFLKSDELGLYQQGVEQPFLEKVVVIDAHTGLGPQGVDTLSHGGIATYSSETTEQFQKAFPLETSSNGDVLGGLKSSSGDGANVLAGYTYTVGDTCDFFHEQMFNNLRARNPQNVVCMTQEFGTYPNTIVGTALVAENHMFHQGTPDQRELYGKRLKQAFYIRSKKWTRAVVHRGMELYMQAIDFVRN